MDTALLALIILLSFVLIPALLIIAAPFTALFRYDKVRGDSDVVIIFRLMGIKVWSNRPKKKKEKEDPIEKKKIKIKASPSQYLSFILDIIKITEKFTSNVTCTKLVLHFQVKGDDAAETAMSYGKINTAIYTALAFLQNKITIKNPDISIEANFDGNEKPPKIYISLHSSGYNNLKTLFRIFSLYRKNSNLFR